MIIDFRLKIFKVEGKRYIICSNHEILFMLLDPLFYTLMPLVVCVHVCVCVCVCACMRVCVINGYHSSDDQSSCYCSQRSVYLKVHPQIHQDT